MQSTGSVASLAKAFTSSVTAGSAIAVGVVSNANTCGTSSVTGGGTYSRSVLNNATGSGRGETAGYTALNVAGGSVTVTFTPTSSDYCGIGIAEFSGVATSSAGDGTGTASANAGTYTISSYTPTDDGVALGVCTQNEGSTTITPSNTQVFENEGVTSMPINFQYKLTTGTSNPNLSWTLGSARQGCAAGWQLKQAVGGGGGELLAGGLALMGVGK